MISINILIHSAHCCIYNGETQLLYNYVETNEESKRSLAEGL